MSINERIKRIRESLDLSQEKFGLTLGYKQSYIDNYEREAKKIPHSFLLAVLKVYPQKFWWLLTGEEEKKPESDTITKEELQVLRDKLVEATRRMIEIEVENQNLRKRNDFLQDHLIDVYNKTRPESHDNATTNRSHPNRSQGDSTKKPGGGPRGALG